ncbi:YitT family protein [Aminirod propionatiphilus]|uniref:YitT family protein n=1 Tax=Aminirod propionatiphilus TaxID=3415223 RepID=A0ACD1DV42_9BACT|nr:YitT family protein [Synergistota bacterium]
MEVLSMNVRKLFVLLRREGKTFALVTAGTVVMCAGIVAFTLPYRFPDVGVTGLAVLSNYLWGISPSWIIGAANGLLFLWAWRGLSPRFVGWSAYSVALTTAALELLKLFPYPHLSEPLLAAVLGGVVKGLGIGLVFLAGASTGGTDIIVVTLRKRFGIDVGLYSFYINAVILFLSAFVIGLENALYGLLSMYAVGVVMDGVLKSFDRRKQVFVITAEMEEVRRFVTEDLHKGVTLLHGTGGYTGQERTVLMSFMTQRQTVELKRFLASLDPRAFMAVGDASEVVGQGFKPWKKDD